MWCDFEDAHDEVLTITKLKDDLFYIRAWKKDGRNFVPALNAIHSISQKASAAKLGAFIQEIITRAKTKAEWADK